MSEKEALESFLSRLEFWQIICACLVALGVGGEFVLAAAYRPKAKTLRAIQHTEDLAQQQTIEELRNKNLELVKLIKEPRTLDAKEANKILAAYPKGAVDILYVDANEEAKNLALTLANVLAAGGWTVLSINSGIGIDAVWGVTLEINRETWDACGGSANLPATEKTLEKLITNAIRGNARMTQRPNADLPKDRILIIVGPKY